MGNPPLFPLRLGPGAPSEVSVRRRPAGVACKPDVLLEEEPELQLPDPCFQPSGATFAPRAADVGAEFFRTHRFIIPTALAFPVCFCCRGNDADDVTSALTGLSRAKSRHVEPSALPVGAGDTAGIKTSR